VYPKFGEFLRLKQPIFECFDDVSKRESTNGKQIINHEARPTFFQNVTNLAHRRLRFGCEFWPTLWN